ncbi:signal recognition particle protein [Mycobacterium tuberculosis EAS054]|nr:signal recognition particle protein [Mycobacterium tuberculosis EAS054]
MQGAARQGPTDRCRYRCHYPRNSVGAAGSRCFATGGPGIHPPDQRTRRGAEVSSALNPAQQVVKIVNEELISILGGETRELAFAKTPPTVVMLAGLQGSGKTTLAGKLAARLRGQGHTPLLVAL